MIKALLIGILCFGFMDLRAQEAILGCWNMVDNESGRIKNTIKFYKKGNEYFGKIVDTNPKPGTDPNPICDQCPGDRKGDPVIGMDVVTNLKFDTKAGEFVGGEILNPKNGNEYACKVWLGKDGNLRVRGYKFFFHKTYVLPPSDKEF